MCSKIENLLLTQYTGCSKTEVCAGGSKKVNCIGNGKFVHPKFFRYANLRNILPLIWGKVCSV